MPLAAGTYRGRIGDRVFFTGASPYAGAGLYRQAASGIGYVPQAPSGTVRLGATGMQQLRTALSRDYPSGIALAGLQGGRAPGHPRRVTLPNGRVVTVY